MPHCKIRLQRFGKPHRPFYRIVATHRNFKRDGKHFERLGTWDPIPDRYGNKHIQLKSDRIHHWLSVGAEPSERVAWLLSRAELTPPAPRRGRPLSEEWLRAADEDLGDVDGEAEGGEARRRRGRERRGRRRRRRRRRRGGRRRGGRAGGGAGRREDVARVDSVF